MINVANFPNAYKEVYVILGYMSENDVNLISSDFLDMIKEKMNKDYEFEYNPNIEFEEQNLLRETKAIFAYIFLNFWADEKQKISIREKYKQDIIESEKNKKLKYPDTDIFSNRKKLKKQDEINLIEYKKENVLTKIINKIKKLFRNKKSA